MAAPKLSRSKVDLFLKCPRCFYLDQKLKIKRPDSYPLTLNLAVDALLKKEFDIHRVNGVAHPAMKHYGIEAVPLRHKNIDLWRELDYGRGGIHYLDPESGFDVYGVVDDIWTNAKGELFVVDYKATSKASAPTLDGDLGEQYKRQMEFYQWLLRRNGFTVSSTGYFFYVNGKKDAKAFDGKLEFDVSIIPCVGDDTWIQPTIAKVRACLDKAVPPPAGNGCEYCAYRTQAGKALQALVLPVSKMEKPKKIAETKAKKETKSKSVDVGSPAPTLF